MFVDFMILGKMSTKKTYVPKGWFIVLNRLKEIQKFLWYSYHSCSWFHAKGFVASVQILYPFKTDCLTGHWYILSMVQDMKRHQHYWILTRLICYVGCNVHKSPCIGGLQNLYPNYWSFYQLMVNCWLGLVVWDFRGVPKQQSLS